MIVGGHPHDWAPVSGMVSLGAGVASARTSKANEACATVPLASVARRRTTYPPVAGQRR